MTRKSKRLKRFVSSFHHGGINYLNLFKDWKSYSPPTSYSRQDLISNSKDAAYNPELGSDLIASNLTRYSLSLTSVSIWVQRNLICLGIGIFFGNKIFKCLIIPHRNGYGANTWRKFKIIPVCRNFSGLS